MFKRTPLVKVLRMDEGEWARVEQGGGGGSC